MAVIFGQDLTRAALLRRVGRLDQVAGATVGQYADGPERSLRYVDLRSGAGLELRVLVDRGFDLGELRVDGIPLSWRSPNGFRAPALHDPEGDRGAGLLRSIDGFMVTCGLDHVRGAAEGSGEHFGPRRQRLFYPLHGRIGMTPAQLTGYGERWDGEQCVLWCEGLVRQTSLYGEALTLLRRIEVPLGDTSIELVDRVTNAGFSRTPHLLLYHLNFGFPLLDEGADLLLPRAVPEADAAWAAAAQPGPEAGATADEVLDFPVSGGDWTGCALVNAGLRGGIALEVGFDPRPLPRLQIWRNRSAGIYVLAVEPATNAAVARHMLEDHGAIRYLDPGASVDYRLRLTAHTGSEALAQLRRRLLTA